MPVQLIFVFLAARLAEARRHHRDDGERGASDLVTTVIMIAAFAAAAIVICGILISKATDAANSVHTQ